MSVILYYFFKSFTVPNSHVYTCFSNNSREWNYNSTIHSQTPRMQIKIWISWEVPSDFRAWSIRKRSPDAHSGTRLRCLSSGAGTAHWGCFRIWGQTWNGSMALWESRGPGQVSLAWDCGPSCLGRMSLPGPVLTTVWNDQFRASPWWTAEHKRNLCCSCQETSHTWSKYKYSFSINLQSLLRQ